MKRPDSASTTPAAPVRQPLDLRATLLMLSLCVVWGIQQIAMKAVAPQIAPAMQLWVRFAIAAVFFGAWSFWQEGTRVFCDGTLRSGLLMGVLFSLEFILVGEALRHTTAAHSVVFLYTSPLFTAVGVQFLPEERLSRIQWAGIGVAVFGIAVAFLGGAAHSASEMIIGDALALCAAAAWGATNVVLRRGRVGNAPTYKTVFYQLGVATLIIGAFALASRQTHLEWTPLSMLSMAFQTLLVAIGSYLLWFWLLRRYLTSRLAMMTLLTPLLGVLFGAALLHDRIDGRFAVGTALVLAGMLIVNNRRPGAMRR